MTAKRPYDAVCDDLSDSHTAMAQADDLIHDVINRLATGNAIAADVADECIEDLRIARRLLDW